MKEGGVRQAEEGSISKGRGGESLRATVEVGKSLSARHSTDIGSLTIKTLCTLLIMTSCKREAKLEKCEVNCPTSQRKSVGESCDYQGPPASKYYF